MGQWAKRKTSKQPDGNFEATKDHRLSMNSAFLKYVLQTEVDTLSQVFRTFKQGSLLVRNKKALRRSFLLSISLLKVGFITFSEFTGLLKLQTGIYNENGVFVSLP